MYKNCREELLAVLTEYVKEKGENEFTRAEAIAAMRRAGSKYKSGSVSAHLSYRCCANVPRYYKPMYNDYEKIGDGLYNKGFINYICVEYEEKGKRPSFFA